MTKDEALKHREERRRMATQILPAVIANHGKGETTSGLIRALVQLSLDYTDELLRQTEKIVWHEEPKQKT